MANPDHVPVISSEEAQRRAGRRSKNPNHISNILPVFAKAIKWNQDSRSFHEVKESSMGRVYFQDEDGNVPSNVLLGIYRLDASTLTCTGNHLDSYTEEQLAQRLLVHEKYAAKNPSDANHNVQLKSISAEGSEPFKKLEEEFAKKLVEAAKNGKSNSLFQLDPDLYDRFTSVEKVYKYSKFQPIAKEDDNGVFSIKSKSKASRPTWGKKVDFMMANTSGKKPWKSDKTSFGSLLVEDDRIPEPYPINAFVLQAPPSQGDSPSSKKRRGENGPLSSETVSDSDEEVDKPEIVRCIHLPTSGTSCDQAILDSNNAFLSRVGSSQSFYVDVTIANSKDRRDTTIFQTDISYCNIRFPKFKLTIIGRAPTSGPSDVETEKYNDELLAACGYND